MKMEQAASRMMNTIQKQQEEIGELGADIDKISFYFREKAEIVVKLEDDERKEYVSFFSFNQSIIEHFFDQIQLRFRRLCIIKPKWKKQ